MHKQTRPAVSARIEGLEPRQLLSRPAPIAKYSQPAFYFNDIEASATDGAGTSPPQYLVIRNAGTLPLVFKSSGLQITGPNADAFIFTGKKAPATIQPGATRSIPIAFNATIVGIETATLTATSNDRKHKHVTIQLRGLGTAGVGGDFEPPLQTIFNLYQIPDNVGDGNPSTTNFGVPPTMPNDEVELQQLVKAGPGPVTIQPLAAFVNVNSPAMKVGWYHPGQPELDQHVQLTLPFAEDAQSVSPHFRGKTSFDPGEQSFGIY